jgi:cytochrome b6-f complex iron-sulfur subunit
MSDTLSRRALLIAPLGCAFAAACATTPRYTARDAQWPLSVPVSALEPDGYVVVTAAQLAHPLLVSVHDGAHTAVELVCTHRACEVYPRRDRLICPCHGSQFGLRGEVLVGPASAPLARYPVSLDGETLRIERGEP